jgi:hypothetical protein
VPSLVPFPTRGFRRTRERTSPYVLAFNADDYSFTLASGQTLTYSRSGTRTVFDSSGKIVTLAKNQPPWGAAYNTATGNREPVLFTDRAVTNLCLRTEDFGTTWAAVGTPTRTAGAKAIGDLTLDLLGDDSAGTLEGYTQAVSFTGNAVKALSLFIAKGSATTSAIRLRDTSAGANRLLAIVTWAGTTPSIAMSIGTHITSIPCADGVYRILFQTSSVTAANTNQIEIYPAADSGLSVSETGTLYVGGVQAENYEAPRSYVKSLGSAGSSSSDVLSATLGWLPQDFTVYARLQRPPWAGATMASGFVGGIISQWHTSGNRWGIRYEGATGGIVAYLNDGTTSTTASASIGTGFFDLCVQYNSVTSGGRLRVDTGSGFGAYSSTITGISAWAQTTVYLGQWSTSTENADAGVRRIIVAPGAHTLTGLRGVLD